VHTPQDFYQQLVVLHPDPETGKPDPTKLKGAVMLTRKQSNAGKDEQSLRRR
jgi:hypothetical protein